jgi:radical SAM superfamily enzyme YgiQ (UPF0313 family)
MVSLGLPTAFGALPDGVETTLVDDHVADGCAALSRRPDAVCLGYFTPQATRAHAIADAWRARGVPVIVGGIHPTMAPDDAAQHADAVVTGPVEGLWERILADLAAGRLQPRYAGRHDAPFAAPRRALFAGSGHLRLDVVQTARGCHLGCPFCIVPGAYGQRIVRKDPVAVAEDLAGLRHPCAFVADENPLFAAAGDRAWAEAFQAALTARGGLRRMLTMAAYPRSVRVLDDDRAAAWRRAGLRQIYLICGYMGPLHRELADPALVERMAALRRIGIECLATFTLGHDEDPPEVDGLCLDFWQRTGANLAEVTLSVPFPGTPRFAAYERAGRIRNRDWSRYNGAWAVFEPKGQTAQQLEDRSLRLWDALYDGRSRFAVEQSYLKAFGRGIFAGGGAGTPV